MLWVKFINSTLQFSKKLLGLYTGENSRIESNSNSKKIKTWLRHREIQCKLTQLLVWLKVTLLTRQKLFLKKLGNNHNFQTKRIKESLEQYKFTSSSERRSLMRHWKFSQKTAKISRLLCFELNFNFLWRNRRIAWPHSLHWLIAH